MAEQRGVSATDLDVEGDHIERVEDRVERGPSSGSTPLVGELDTDEQLDAVNAAMGGVGVVGQHRRFDLSAALDRDEHTRVEDQSVHGSAALASPVNRRSSRRSSNPLIIGRMLGQDAT